MLFKISVKDVFNVINQIYKVRQLSTVERVMVRQEKDIIDYFALHLGSIVKSIVVIMILILLLQFENYISITMYSLYFLVGVGFLIVDPLGIRALIFLLVHFFQHSKEVIIEIGKRIKEYFVVAKKNSDKYKMTMKIFYWILTLFVFPFVLLLTVLLLILFLGIYLIFLQFITILSNEVLSLIITYSIMNSLPEMSIYLNYGLLLVCSGFIYYLIDYRVRMTTENLVFLSELKEYKEEIIGLEVLYANEKIEIFEKNAKFYVVFRNLDKMNIYETNSKLKLKSSEIVDWFKNKEIK